MLSISMKVRIRATGGRHPMVCSGWKPAAGPFLTRRWYRAGQAAASRDQAELPGPGGGLGAVGGAELAQHVGHVLFDRVERHDQVAGDALIRSARREQPQHLQLTA